MNIDYEARATDYLYNEDSRFRVENRTSGDIYVTVTRGATDFTFSYLRDGQWRLAYLSTWGNTNSPTGPTVGASGYVLTDPDNIAELDYRSER